MNKKQAASAAVACVENGMKLGPGSGSTAGFVLEKIGKRIQPGRLRSIIGIPDSKPPEHDAQ